MSQKQKNHYKYYNPVPVIEEETKEDLQSSKLLESLTLEELDSDDKEEQEFAITMLVNELNDMKRQLSGLTDKQIKQAMNDYMSFEDRKNIVSRFNDTFKNIPKDDLIYIETTALLYKLGIIITRNTEDDTEDDNEEDNEEDD